MYVLHNVLSLYEQRVCRSYPLYKNFHYLVGAIVKNTYQRLAGLHEHGQCAALQARLIAPLAERSNVESFYLSPAVTHIPEIWDEFDAIFSRTPVY
jgi:hypothetical protein